jgi:pimeloyl-ACP methyl ester carboxylesterase
MPAPATKVKVSDSDELDVWVVGEGTPVLLIHGGFFCNLFAPLVDELARKGGYRLISYHRRGYNGKPTGPVEIPEQAPDIVKILDALDIGKAHVVGHSYGAKIALELAMLAPARLLSVVLGEPVLALHIASEAELGAMFEPVMVKVQSGDLEGAAADFLALHGCTKELMDRALPGSWAAMVRDLPTWFQVEMPALMKWKPDPARVGAIEVPVALVAADQMPLISASRQLLQKWLPESTVIEISGAGDHFFPVKATAGTAAAIDGWIKSQGKS